MIKSNYEVEILVHGHPVKEYWKDGEVYIEGRKGVEFSLKIKNNGYKRILAVPTIDGLSVLNGKEAGYDSPGYIIDGYDSLVIDGWRTSNREIARFYFTNPEDSYSKRTDKKDNLGIIGVAVFKEKDRISNFTDSFPDRPKIRGPWGWRPPDGWWDLKDWWKADMKDSADSGDYRLSADNTCLNKASGKIEGNSAKCFLNRKVSQDLGTGFGGYKESHCSTVEFDREDNPDAVFTIFYNIREQLKKIGVDFNERPKYAAPQAFPNGFCEPPR